MLTWDFETEAVTEGYDPADGGRAGKALNGMSHSKTVVRKSASTRNAASMRDEPAPRIGTSNGNAEKAHSSRPGYFRGDRVEVVSVVWSGWCRSGPRYRLTAEALPRSIIGMAERMW